MNRIFAATATAIFLTGCSSVPLALQDARDLYRPICFSDQEKERLRKSRALDRGTLERIILNNANFGVECSTQK